MLSREGRRINGQPLEEFYSDHMKAYNVYSTKSSISKLNNEKKLLKDYTLYCFDDENTSIKFKINRKWIKHPTIDKKYIWDGDYYFMSKKGMWTINEEIKTNVIQAPNGSYCHKCLKKHNENIKYDYEGKIKAVGHRLCWDDLEPMKFWTPCKECKIAKSRGRAARKWTDVIKYTDPHMDNTRFITLTMRDEPRWDMQELFDPFGFEYDFNKKEDFDKFLHLFSRMYYKDGWRYKGTMNIKDYVVLEEASKEARKKLVNRLRKLRHDQRNKKALRFQKKVQGGIYCYECTINLHPESREVSIHPHIHAITYGSYYNQEQLQEDWGLGIVNIKKVKHSWKVQLEVAKYVGKDGKRYSWGKYRTNSSNTKEVKATKRA